MPREMSLTLPFLAIIVLAFVIGALFLSGMIVFKLQGAAEIPTLDVTGTAKAYVQPDKVDVYLSVETEDESALISQQRNAEIIAEVRKAVIGQGLSADQIETSSYSLYPVRTWDDEGNVHLIGYRTLHSLRLKITDLSSTGRLIDAAVSAGVNDVDSIVFGLSDQRYEELRSQVLLNATANAKAKADALAAQMDVKITGIQHASEGYVSVIPLYRTMEEYAAAGAGAVPTEISPGQIEVSASMSISYRIG